MIIFLNLQKTIIVMIDMKVSYCYKFVIYDEENNTIKLDRYTFLISRRHKVFFLSFLSNLSILTSTSFFFLSPSLKTKISNTCNEPGNHYFKGLLRVYEEISNEYLYSSSESKWVQIHSLISELALTARVTFLFSFATPFQYWTTLSSDDIIFGTRT